MKSFFGAALLLAIVALASAASIFGNGQPDCSTDQAINIRIFRNNWDPTAYWKCEALNEPASLVRCPDQMAFLNSAKDCVGWDQWVWEEPTAPLSESSTEE